MAKETVNIRLVYVPKAEIADYWGIAGPLIELAQRRYSHEYGLEDVRKALDDGRAILWMVQVDGEFMAAMTTTEDNQPRRRTLLIELLGGKNADIWAETLIDELARVGRAAGYDAIETKARLGWMRLAKKHNFRPKYVAYEMDLK
jgi:hypothetical protein|tara:strand:- start:704 stop:1138 length:435 start_codon:yes stop_codon:yes gene_type:complete